MGLIKDIYSKEFYNSLTDYLVPVIPSFSKKKFTDAIFSDGFKDMEWKERMKHTTTVLHRFMPANFAEAMTLLKQVVTQLQTDGFGESLAFIFLPDYIETYGLDDFDTAVQSLDWMTQFVSCEFAVRPFLLKYGQRMIDVMIQWSLHTSYKVRRLASEGSRPRLPWAMAIPALKKDPAPVLPLLENLKNDPSEWVRRSVANNLNDIAKDHPAIVLAIARKWKGISKETDAIIKHGSRTLLKQGHAEILNHYGLESKNVSMSGFEIVTPQVKIGDSLEFVFTVRNNDKESQTVRLEYGVYYNKANGQLAKKVFKISEKIYQPKEAADIRRKQSFKLITTRKFYPGKHQLSVIINGTEKEVRDFELLDR